MEDEGSRTGGFDFEAVIPRSNTPGDESDFLRMKFCSLHLSLGDFSDGLYGSEMLGLKPWMLSARPDAIDQDGPIQDRRKGEGCP